MAKYKLTKTVRYFNKANRLYIERKANRYFITEGHVMLALNENVYKENFVNKYPKRFTEIEEGKRITSDSEGIHPDGVKIAEYLDKAIREAEYEVTRTRLTYETRKETKVQIYKGKEPIFINSLYDEIAREIFSFMYEYPTMNGSNGRSPIVLSDHNYEQQFLMLPVYVDRKEVEQEMMRLFN